MIEGSDRICRRHSLAMLFFGVFQYFIMYAGSLGNIGRHIHIVSNILQRSHGFTQLVPILIESLKATSNGFPNGNASYKNTDWTTVQDILIGEQDEQHSNGSC